MWSPTRRVVGRGDNVGNAAQDLPTRRSVLARGSTALAVGALVGCGQATGPDASGGAGVPRVPSGTVVTYLAFHNAVELQIVQSQMQRFEQRHAGAKVEITNLAQAAMFEKFATMMAAGTPPDLIRSGGTQWAQYANQAGFAEIDSRIKRDKYDLSDFVDPALKQWVWKGKQLALGAAVACSLIYYNTQMFKEQGIPAPSDDWAKPWTWEQFTDAARRTTPRTVGGESEQFGFTGINFQRLLVTNGGANGAWLTNDEETRTHYDTPEAIEGWEWLYDLVHTHKVAQNPLTFGAQTPVQAFVTGKSALWLSQVSDAFTQLVPYKDLPWDVAPTPRGPRLTRDKWGWGGGTAWFIPAGSKVIDPTWELIKHMTSPEPVRDLAAGGLMPVRVSVLNSPAWVRPADQPPKSKRPLVDGIKHLMSFPKITNWDRFDKAIGDEAQALWRGERRGREVAQRIRQVTDPILAEHQQALKAGK